MNNIKLLIKLYLHLNNIFKGDYIKIILLMILASFAELCSLASVIPFLTVIRDPDNLLKNNLIKNITLSLNLDTSFDLIIVTTIIFIFINVISSLIRLLNIKYSAFVVAKIGSELSTKLYKNIISLPYSKLVTMNTGDIVSKVTADINITINVLNSVNNLLTSTFIIVTLLIGLFSYNTKIALITLITFSLSYISIALRVKKNLYLNSKKITYLQSEQVKSIQESMGSIRDLILSNSQKYFSSIYRNKDAPLRLILAENQFLALAPRYLMESISISFIAILAFYSISNSQNNQFLIPLLGALALAAQKLLPAVQQAYFSWVYIQGSTGSLEKVVEYLFLKEVKEIKEIKKIKIDKFESLELINVSYKYQIKDNYEIENINIKINKGERIGIMGPTGCGKSTTLDLMMCLLEPTEGIVKLNGLDIYNKFNKDIVQQYQRNIAHVPQNIYLIDGTVEENIAFGVEKGKVDYKKVKKAAGLALIKEIINESKNGYSMNIGENGIKLSGGQRQRIGIARSLYKEFDILFLDEATSALDYMTEKKIINNLQKLNPNTTIIMISHRIDSLFQCDKVIIMNKGRIQKCIKGEYLIKEKLNYES